LVETREIRIKRGPEADAAFNVDAAAIPAQVQAVRPPRLPAGPERNLLGVYEGGLFGDLVAWGKYSKLPIETQLGMALRKEAPLGTGLRSAQDQFWRAFPDRAEALIRANLR
jgi:hypothetical protein